LGHQKLALVQIGQLQFFGVPLDYDLFEAHFLVAKVTDMPPRLTGIFVGNLFRSARTSSLRTSPLESLSSIFTSITITTFRYEKQSRKKSQLTCFFGPAAMAVKIEIGYLPRHYFKRATVVVFALVSEQLVAAVAQIH
jgi:hypothetical protein